MIYHGKGALDQFLHSISDLDNLFDEIVPEFDRRLIKARTFKYKKEMHRLVQNIIGPALSVFETGKMMKTLERCANLWDIYDHLTTSAKEMGIYEKFLLQEAAGNIIYRLVSNAEYANKSGPEN